MLNPINRLISSICNKNYPKPLEASLDVQDLIIYYSQYSQSFRLYNLMENDIHDLHKITFLTSEYHILVSILFFIYG